MNFTTKEPEYLGEASLQLRYKLPCCGTVITQSCIQEADHRTKRIFDTLKLSDDWGAVQGNILDIWRKDRVARHECKLVSEENPFGLKPQ